MTRYALAEEARHIVGRRMAMDKDTDVQAPPYTNEGIEGTIEIWKEFEMTRKEIRERGGEVERRNRDEEWEWREL